MVLGDTCTRVCRFCALNTGAQPAPLDEDELLNVAAEIAQWGIRYVVLTRVERDDGRWDCGSFRKDCAIHHASPTRGSGGVSGGRLSWRRNRGAFAGGVRLRRFRAQCGEGATAAAAREGQAGQVGAEPDLITVAAELALDARRRNRRRFVFRRRPHRRIALLETLKQYAFWASTTALQPHVLIAFVESFHLRLSHLSAHRTGELSAHVTFNCSPLAFTPTAASTTAADVANVVAASRRRCIRERKATS
ncbi:Lipoyl synthase [Gracilaria domingensis]|nr:Lipoyl synthase [Gracilaria domingensis]